MTNEHAELFETYRSSFRLMISTISFLATADIALISIAINNKSAFMMIRSGIISF